MKFVRSSTTRRTKVLRFCLRGRTSVCIRGTCRRGRVHWAFQMYSSWSKMFTSYRTSIVMMTSIR